MGLDFTDHFAVENVDPIDGTVTFKTDSFSPYSVIYTIDCDMFYDEKTSTYNVFTADGMMEVHDKFAKGQAGQAKIKLQTRE